MELKKGVFYDITNEDYHADDRFVSRSHLHNLKQVPAGAKAERKNNGAMGIGTGAHYRILEPHLYDEMVLESKNKTSASKDFQSLAEENPDKCIVTKGSKEKIDAIVEAVYKHPFAASLLEEFVAEPTILWQDEGTELWCKTRPDILIPERRIFADLKFLAKGKADERKFSWAVRDFGYDLQAAGNIVGMKRATGVLYTEFWFIVCETDEPYRVSCYQLDEDWLGDSAIEWHQLLQIEAECRANNDWPNYTKANAEGETLYKF